MIIEIIENKAEELLNKLNAKSIPVQVEEIANKLQIKISRAPHKDFSGLLIRKDGYSLIGINNSEAPVRQRFTIAHELGHFFIHPRKDTFVDYRNNKNTVRTPVEKQADMFAAALLMPRTLLERDFKALKRGVDESDLLTLANKYQVSEDAMKFRLLNLNFLK
jgi:Zn-dependent peptidase ImmA (M78 family)